MSPSQVSLSLSHPLQVPLTTNSLRLSTHVANIYREKNIENICFALFAINILYKQKLCQYFSNFFGKYYCRLCVLSFNSVICLLSVVDKQRNSALSSHSVCGSTTLIVSHASNRSGQSSAHAGNSHYISNHTHTSIMHRYIKQTKSYHFSTHRKSPISIAFFKMIFKRVQRKCDLNMRKQLLLLFRLGIYSLYFHIIILLVCTNLHSCTDFTARAHHQFRFIIR